MENPKIDWLPQMCDNFEYIQNALNDSGVSYKIDLYDPSDLKPLKDDQSDVSYFNEKITNRDKLYPLFISVDNEIMDGHKRHKAYLMNPSINRVYCIKIFLDKLNCARVLNKIQDKYNWEIENNYLDKGYELSHSTNDGQPNTLQEDEDTKNPMEMTVYSNRPINPNSKTGNYCLTERKKMFDNEYVLEFENVLESGKVYSSNAMKEILESWGINEKQLKEEAARHAFNVDAYLDRKIVEEAKKKGYDCITYKLKETSNEDIEKEDGMVTTNNLIVHAF